MDEGMRRTGKILALLLYLLAPGMAWAEDVWLLASGEGYAPLMGERLRAALPLGLTLGEQRLSEGERVQCPGARLVLAEGEAAARAALQGCPKARVWAFALPARSLAELGKSAAGRVSGIPFDVPLARQVDVLARIRPQPRTVAVPYAPAMEGLAREAEQVLRARGLQPILLPSVPDSQPLRPLREVLDEVQAVLALPDPALYHEGLLKHWLLMTAREGVPMVGGLGRRDVRRGMAAAAVQPEEAVAELTVRLLPHLLGSGPLPAPQGVDGSTVMRNPLMLERLNLRLEEAR